MNTNNNNKCPQCSQFRSQLLLDGDRVGAKKLYKLYFYAAHQGCSVCSNPSSSNPTSASLQDVRPLSFIACISLFTVRFLLSNLNFDSFSSHRFYPPILQGQLRARATLVILQLAQERQWCWPIGE